MSIDDKMHELLNSESDLHGTLNYKTFNFCGRAALVHAYYKKNHLEKYNAVV